MKSSREKPSWFGKLPCVGDFCSYNMSAGLLETLDLWLSTAMQQGVAIHGNAWMNAYFQTPMHGFIWGPQVTHHLHNEPVIGIIMPSVDKAGRAFPFVLIQTLQNNSNEHTAETLAFESVALWFKQAHMLCAEALNEDWCLSKFESESESLSSFTDKYARENLIKVGSTQSHWFRIDYDGAIKSVLQCEGLPASEDFNVLLGFGTTPC